MTPLTIAKGYAARFAAETGGAVAITFALAVLPLLGAVGAAVDYSRLSLAQTKKQSAADAAALAGAQAMLAKQGQIASVVEAAGVAAATAVINGRAPGAQKTITAALSTRSINVKVSQSENIIFGGFVGKQTSTVGAESTAVFDLQPDCIILMEPSQTALLLNMDAKVTGNCGIRANSTSNSAIQVNGGSQIKATSTCVAGSVFLNGGTISPAARTGCAKAPDPLATLPDPPEATNPCPNTNTIVSSGQSQTLSPGVYCTKFDVNGGTATLRPGNYIIRDVPLVVNSGGKLIGDDVMLFFMGQNGRLVVNQDSTIALSGRTSGTHSGMVIFQSRDPITLQTAPFIFTSSADAKLVGTVYLPNGSVQMNAKATGTVVSPWTVFVLRAMQLNSLAQMLVNIDYASGPPLPAQLANLRFAEGVRLIK